jgi:tetratricopeptide (TPR) repeat protein
LVVSSADADTGQMRFALLETIREFAMEELVAAGEAERVFDRHLTWCAALAEQGWSEMWGSNMPYWLDLLDREHDNLRLGLDHAAGAGDTMIGLRTAHHLWPLWDIRGHYREGHRRLRLLLDLADDTPSLERGRSLDALGWLTGLLGDFEESYPIMKSGLEMVRATGQPLDIAWSLGEQGNVAFTVGDAEQAHALFSESLEIARALDQTFLIGWNLFGLGYAALLEGDLETMAANLNEALELTRLLYQPWGIAWAQFSLGIVSYMTGDVPAATRQVLESLELRWSIRDARGTTESLGVVAALTSAAGDMERAARLHGANELQREANGLGVFPFLQPVHDESIARIVEALGQAETDRLWREGRATPLEKIVSEALTARDEG